MMMNVDDVKIVQMVAMSAAALAERLGLPGDSDAIIRRIEARVPTHDDFEWMRDVFKAAVLHAEKTVQP